jgi:RNA polymerase sigma-70 factor (sigma-E family)
VLDTVRAGANRNGFDAVFGAHHRSAVRLAYLLTSDEHQAEDVVAEAFTKIYPRWRAGQVRDMGAYVRRAVVNEANSKLRRRYRDRDRAQHRVGDGRGVRRVDDHAADRDQVWQALGRLPQGQRTAVVLRYYEDLSEARTAEVLDVSVGTVKSQVARGLSRLEQLLGPGEGTATDTAGGG